MTEYMISILKLAAKLFLINNGIWFNIYHCTLSVLSIYILFDLDEVHNFVYQMKLSRLHITLWKFRRFVLLDKFLES